MPGIVRPVTLDDQVPGERGHGSAIPGDAGALGEPSARVRPRNAGGPVRIRLTAGRDRLPAQGQP